MSDSNSPEGTQTPSQFEPQTNSEQSELSPVFREIQLGQVIRNKGRNPSIARSVIVDVGDPGSAVFKVFHMQRVLSSNPEFLVQDDPGDGSVVEAVAGIAGRSDQLINSEFDVDPEIWDNQKLTEVINNYFTPGIIKKFPALKKYHDRYLADIQNFDTKEPRVRKITVEEVEKIIQLEQNEFERAEKTARAAGEAQKLAAQKESEDNQQGNNQE